MELLPSIKDCAPLSLSALYADLISHVVPPQHSSATTRAQLPAALYSALGYFAYWALDGARWISGQSPPSAMQLLSNAVAPVLRHSQLATLLGVADASFDQVLKLFLEDFSHVAFLRGGQLLFFHDTFGAFLAAQFVLQTDLAQPILTFLSSSSFSSALVSLIPSDQDSSSSSSSSSSTTTLSSFVAPPHFTWNHPSFIAQNWWIQVYQSAVQLLSQPGVCGVRQLFEIFFTKSLTSTDPVPSFFTLSPPPPFLTLSQSSSPTPSSSSSLSSSSSSSSSAIAETTTTTTGNNDTSSLESTESSETGSEVTLKTGGQSPSLEMFLANVREQHFQTPHVLFMYVLLGSIPASYVRGALSDDLLKSFFETVRRLLGEEEGTFCLFEPISDITRCFPKRRAIPLIQHGFSLLEGKHVNVATRMLLRLPVGEFLVQEPHKMSPFLDGCIDPTCGTVRTRKGVVELLGSMALREGRLTPFTSFSYIISALGDSDISVRRTASSVLIDMGYQALDLLYGPSAAQPQGVHPLSDRRLYSLSRFTACIRQTAVRLFSILWEDDEEDLDDDRDQPEYFSSNIFGCPVEDLYDKLVFDLVRLYESPEPGCRLLPFVLLSDPEPRNRSEYQQILDIEESVCALEMLHMLVGLASDALPKASASACSQIVTSRSQALDAILPALLPVFDSLLDYTLGGTEAARFSPRYLCLLVRHKSLVRRAAVHLLKRMLPHATRASICRHFLSSRPADDHQQKLLTQFIAVLREAILPGPDDLCFHPSVVKSAHNKDNAMLHPELQEIIFSALAKLSAAPQMPSLMVPEAAHKLLLDLISYETSPAHLVMACQPIVLTARVLAEITSAHSAGPATVATPLLASVAPIMAAASSAMPGTGGSSLGGGGGSLGGSGSSGSSGGGASGSGSSSGSPHTLTPSDVHTLLRSLETISNFTTARRKVIVEMIEKHLDSIIGDARIDPLIRLSAILLLRGTNKFFAVMCAHLAELIEKCDTRCQATLAQLLQQIHPSGEQDASLLLDQLFPLFSHSHPYVRSTVTTCWATLRPTSAKTEERIFAFLATTPAGVDESGDAPDSLARETALRILPMVVRHISDRYLNIVMQALGLTSARVFVAAIESLRAKDFEFSSPEKFRRRASPALLSNLLTLLFPLIRDPHAEVRFAAIDALAGMKPCINAFCQATDGQVEVLKSLLTEDEDVAVRHSALHAIANAGPNYAIKVANIVYRMMRHPLASMRKCAVRAMREIPSMASVRPSARPVLAHYLEGILEHTADDDPHVRRKALKVLRAHTDDIQESLGTVERVLRRKIEQLPVQLQALQLVADMGHLSHDHVAILVSLLRNSDVAVLLETTTLLMSLGLSAALLVPAIVNKLPSSPTSRLKRRILSLLTFHAGEAAKIFHEKPTYMATILAMRGDPDAIARATALRFLAPFANSAPPPFDSIVSIATFLGERNPRVRREALITLHKWIRLHPSLVDALRSRMSSMLAEEKSLVLYFQIAAALRFFIQK